MNDEVSFLVLCPSRSMQLVSMKVVTKAIGIPELEPSITHKLSKYR
jgi:hypothetical protein